MARREFAALGFDPAPGDVGAVASAARGVDGAGRVFNDASANVGQLDSSGWTGAAGDAFRGQLKDLPRDLDMAARSHRSTAQALTEYGAGLQSRQRRADELESRAEELRRQQAAALAEVNRIAARRVPAGSRELASMRSQYDSARSTAESLGTELQQVVADARRLRDEHESAAGSAATRIRAVTAAPYREPGRLSRALSAVKRWISDHAEVLTEISTVLKGVSAVLGVLSLVPGLQFLAPFAIAAGGAALALDAAVKAVTGKGSWASIGLDASLTFMPWGRAAALVRRVRGTSRALDATGRLVGGARGRLRSAAANPRQTAVPVERRACVGDPVDVATGDVVLDQVDVELPGLLPLVLRRVHVSSYRAGRLFGRSWASTLDQRLEVDDEGICLAGDDGTVLVYPPPAAGPVLPEDGPPLPLARTDGGGYTLTDPLSGRTRLFTGGAQPGVLPLTAVTDRNGHRIEIDRDVDGAPVEVRHSGGYRIAVETLAGRVRSLRLLDPAGGTDTVLLRFKFAGGDLVEVVNSSGLPLRFAYDDEGRLIRWEDRNRTWYAYEYDDLGRCVRTSGSGGFLAGAFSYDSDRMVTVATDSLGHRRAFHLNEALQVVREVDPLGHMTVSDWDRSDRLLSRTDPLGRTTRYDYGPDGELVRVVRPDGGETAVTPGGPGEPATLVEPDGAVWEREHDENGNLVAVTDPTGATTRYAYDDRGRLTAIIDALGQVRHVETDPAGLPLATADPAGAVTRFQRDAFGRVVAATDPLGQTIRLQWTVEGKLVARTLPDGTTERWDYDGEGNLVEYVDPLGQVTRATVTGFGLPSARTGPDGARLEFAYDTELRLVAVTDPRGLVWRYDYDPAGRLISETDFNGRVLRYRYDAAGQLVTRSNGAGERIRYRRDLLGRVSEQRSTDAVMTFERDRVGRL
ncbi:MAG TPA: DUF6531 domain-containing protein, partial [Mycobacteriales bacterium]|nr:DUF6531 domain-containing protein [Mycobacteriales bacterium]